MSYQRIQSPGPVEIICGYPFGPDPAHPDLADMARCLYCGQVVDVGGEIRAHIADHEDERREMEESR